MSIPNYLPNEPDEPSHGYEETKYQIIIGPDIRIDKPIKHRNEPELVWVCGDTEHKFSFTRADEIYGQLHEALQLMEAMPGFDDDPSTWDDTHKWQKDSF